MISKRSALVVLSMFVASTHGIPARTSRSSVPAWHQPCGQNLEPTSTQVENFEEEVGMGLEAITLQHKLAMSNYLNSDYEFLYDQARRGVDKHQYIPTWIPGKKDVNSVKKLKDSGVERIANHLAKLHTDLQKFAVAFEELIQDATTNKLRSTLISTQSYLIMTLCEVEAVLSSVPPLKIPHRINRSIMSDAERNPVDDTGRLVRDWGILLKYKDYLHAWRHVFDY